MLPCGRPRFWKIVFFCMYIIVFTLQNCLIRLVLSIGSMLERLVLKNAVERTSQRLKWTSGARVLNGQTDGRTGGRTDGRTVWHYVPRNVCCVFPRRSCPERLYTYIRCVMSRAKIDYRKSTSMSATTDNSTLMQPSQRLQATSGVSYVWQEHVWLRG